MSTNSCSACSSDSTPPPLIPVPARRASRPAQGNPRLYAPGRGLRPGRALPVVDAALLDSGHGLTRRPRIGDRAVGRGCAPVPAGRGRPRRSGGALGRGGAAGSGPPGSGPFRRRAVHPGLPAAERRPRAGVVHAPSGEVAARVPRRPRAGQHPRRDRAARAGGRLRPLDPEIDPPYVIEAVGILADRLAVPLIGFAGGPFTVASYLVEGGPSKNFTRVKALMHCEPGIWHELIERLCDMALASLRSQLDAGASAVQVFDSWAGILPPRHYAELVLPATRRLFAELADTHPGIPTILFGVGTGELLAAMSPAGSAVVGIVSR